MDRRIIHWGLSALLLTSVAVGATVSTKSADSSRASKKGTPTAQPSQPAETIQWVTDLKQAQRLSEITGRPILIVFGGPKCEFCRKLDREVLSHATIVRYVSHTFVPVHLDAVKDARAVKILDVKAVPTTVILSPQADLLGTIEGYVSIKEYATVLKQSVDFQKVLKSEQVALKSQK